MSGALNALQGSGGGLLSLPGPPFVPDWADGWPDSGDEVKASETPTLLRSRHLLQVSRLLLLTLRKGSLTLPVEPGGHDYYYTGRAGAGLVAQQDQHRT